MNQKARTLTFAFAIGGILISTAVQAGHPKHERSKLHSPPDAEHQLARLDRALDLSDEQSAELLTILQAAEAERKALHQRIKEEFQPEICAQMDATHDAIVSALTTDQAEEFESMVAGRKDRFGSRGPRGGIGDVKCDER